MKTKTFLYKVITIEEFKALELEDVNYSSEYFTWWKPEYDDIIKEKLTIDWLLGKSYRIEDVLKQRMFYVENCDIQTPDTFYWMVESILDDEMTTVVFIGEEW